MLEFRAASTEESNDTTDLLVYGDIGDSMWAEVGASDFARQLQEVQTPKLRVRINSIGGNVFAGLSIYNNLRAWATRGGDVEVRIDGLAASIASVVAMAGKTIVMPANAMMMVHRPWVAMSGNSDDLRKTAETLDKLIDNFAAIYSARTGQSDQMVRDLMNNETWLDAQSAKGLGFADIVEPEDIEASLAGEMFSVAGQEFAAAVVPQFAQILARMCPPAPSGGAEQTTENTQEDNTMSTQFSPEPTVVEPAAQVPDLEAVKAAARAEEQSRVKTILASAKKLGVADDVAQKLIDDNLSIGDARAKLIDAVAVKEPQISGISSVSVGMESVEHMGRGIQNALLNRADSATPLEEVGRPYQGYGLLELAEMSLAAHGINVRGRSKWEKAKMALAFRAAGGQHTNSDFPAVLGNTANKSMFKGYTETPRTFLPFCRQRNLADLKAVTTVGLGEIPTILDIAEAGEYQRVSLGERQESWNLSKAGAIFSITLEALINDDLSAFTRIPQLFGASCARKQSDVVWALITGKAHMSDGKDWCHADHDNMATGGDINPPDADTIAAMQSLLMAQKGVDGVSIVGVPGRYLALPVCLGHGVRQLLGTNYLPTTTAQAVTDDQRALTIIEEPRLDVASTTEWYLFASPNDIDTIEYGFLAGSEGPQLSRQEGFDVDGVDFKATQFFGAHIMDWRGLAYNLGT